MGNAVTLSAMDHIRQRIVGSAPMTALFGAFLSVLRPMTARAQTETVSPAQMLEVWSYEASPFCTKVREVLCALQMAYVLKNVAHGSKQKRGEFAIRFGKKYPAWKQRWAHCSCRCSSMPIRARSCLRWLRLNSTCAIRTVWRSEGRGREGLSG